MFIAEIRTDGRSHDGAGAGGSLAETQGAMCEITFKHFLKCTSRRSSRSLMSVWIRGLKRASRLGEMAMNKPCAKSVEAVCPWSSTWQKCDVKIAVWICW